MSVSPSRSTVWHAVRIANVAPVRPWSHPARSRESRSCCHHPPTSVSNCGPRGVIVGVRRYQSPCGLHERPEDVDATHRRALMCSITRPAGGIRTRGRHDVRKPTCGQPNAPWRQANSVRRRAASPQATAPSFRAWTTLRMPSPQRYSIPLTPDHAANATLASAGLYPVRAAYQSTAFVDTEYSIAEIARHHIQPRSIAPATYRDRQLADKPMRRGRPPAVPGRCPR